MSKQDFIRKITSRKFILAIFLIVFGVLCTLGVIPADTQEQWKAYTIMAAGVVAYIFGEGATDIVGIIKSNKEESVNE